MSFHVFLSIWLLIGFAFGAAAQPTNDNRANAAVLGGEIIATSGNNDGATRETGDPTDVQYDGSGSPTGGSSVWWRWTAPRSARTQISTGKLNGTEQENSTFDTQLGVYLHGTNPLTEVASNEDAEELFETLPFGLSSVTFNAVEGTTYLIMVDGYFGESGTIRLYLEQAAGPPEFQLTVRLNPFGGGNFTANPSSASLTYTQGTIVNLTANPSPGYTFLRWMGDVESTNASINVVMNSDRFLSALFSSTNAGVRLTIQQNTGGTVATDIAPNAADGTYIPGTELNLTALPSTNFVFAFWDGDIVEITNPLRFTISSNTLIIANFRASTNPPNDNFEAATVVTGAVVIAEGFNDNATPQSPPEPFQIEGQTITSGRSVWWRWQAPNSGRTTIATGVPGGPINQQSELDTQLAVFTGSNRTNLVEITSNEDAPEFAGGSVGLSLVNFQAVAGTTYHLLVDTHAADFTGRIKLYITNTTDVPLQPRLSIARSPNGLLISSIGQEGLVHDLQSSTNLLFWNFFSLITNNSSAVAISPSGPAMFFRINE